MNTETTTQTKEMDRAEKIQQRPAYAPLVDIYENNEELLVVADLPGVAKEDLGISLEKGQLTIEGRRKEATTGAALATEYRPLDFRRAFLIPNGIDTDRIAAELNNGVLRVHLPKAASLKPRRIEVKAS